MSGVLQLLSALSPTPNYPKANYDGLQYTWKMFTFRPAEFKLEGAILGIVGVYLLWFFAGRYINQARAAAAYKPFSTLLAQQFKATRAPISSGPAQHLAYHTGRRNVLGLHITLTLTPIHDLVALVTHYGQAILEPTYDSSETMIFDLTLGRGDTGLQGEGFGVWGLVNRGALRETKEKRWDLTFPRLHETATIPNTHALYTEHSDVTDLLLKTPNIGLSDVLSHPDAAKVLKYLLITDQPARRPTKGPLDAKFRSRHIIVSVYKPSSQAQIDAVKAWVQVALNIADLEGKPGVLKPEVIRKLAKARTQTNTDLGAAYAKEKAEDETPEETAESRRLAKKKAERATMSEKELKRLEELEKKREIRKMQKKGQYQQ